MDFAGGYSKKINGGKMMKKLGIILLTLVMLAAPVTAFADHWGEVQMKYMIICTKTVTLLETSPHM